jgi:hypothetical protein
MPKHLRYFFLVVNFFSSSAMAAEPNFFIRFFSCKTVVGYLSRNVDPVKEFDDEGVTYACNRQRERLTCQLTFDDGGPGVKGKTGEYKIVSELPPELLISLVEGTEHISVNTAEHVAVMSSLRLDTTQFPGRFAGSKVCKGIYLTDLEQQRIRELKNLP